MILRKLIMENNGLIKYGTYEEILQIMTKFESLSNDKKLKMIEKYKKRLDKCSKQSFIYNLSLPDLNDTAIPASIIAFLGLPILAIAKIVKYYPAKVQAVNSATNYLDLELELNKISVESTNYALNAVAIYESIFLIGYTTLFLSCIYQHHYIKNHNGYTKRNLEEIIDMMETRYNNRIENSTEKEIN